jgi:hypothetical protein
MDAKQAGRSQQGRGSSAGRVMDDITYLIALQAELRRATRNELVSLL